MSANGELVDRVLLQMSRLSERDNPTLGKLLIILEEFMKYTLNYQGPDSKDTNM